MPYFSYVREQMLTAIHRILKRSYLHPHKIPLKQSFYNSLHLLINPCGWLVRYIIRLALNHKREDNYILQGVKNTAFFIIT